VTKEIGFRETAKSCFALRCTTINETFRHFGSFSLCRAITIQLFLAKTLHYLFVNIRPHEQVERGGFEMLPHFSCKLHYKWSFED